MIVNGYKTNITPLTDNNISLKKLSSFHNRYQQKQFTKTKALAASSALENDTDIHSDDKDIIDKRKPTRDEMNYIQLEREIYRLPTATK